MGLIDSSGAPVQMAVLAFSLPLPRVLPAGGRGARSLA